MARYVLDAVVVWAGGAPKVGGAGAAAVVVAGAPAPNVSVALEPPNGAAGVGAPNPEGWAPNPPNTAVMKSTYALRVWKLWTFFGRKW